MAFQRLKERVTPDADVAPDGATLPETLRDRPGGPLAGRASGRRGDTVPRPRGRDWRPARARQGLPRDRAAADAGLSAHGACRGLRSTRLCWRKCRRRWKRTCARSSKKSGPRPAKSSTCSRRSSSGRSSLEARLPEPEEDGQDQVRLDGCRGPDGSCRTRLSAAAARARVSRDRQAEGHLRGRAAGAGGRGGPRSYHVSPRPSPPRAGSPPSTRTCRTFPSVRPPAARSAAPSSRRRAASSSSPTTRRSSCASSPTSRATRR